MDWRRKLAQNNSVLGLKIFLRQNPNKPYLEHLLTLLITQNEPIIAQRMKKLGGIKIRTCVGC
jgi:hypothetical protein